MYKPVVLVILDGWGIEKNEKGNPIAHANLPTIEKLNSFYPHLSLEASGISVGLFWGEPGNSEVGHKTIGSGKTSYQSLPRITIDIQNGEFFKNKVFLDTFENVKKNNSSLHLMGMIGEGSVHSNLDHFYALLELSKDYPDIKTYLHLFTDGRDCNQEAGRKIIQEILKKISAISNIKLASLAGRYFAMDRNNNWDRTEKAYNAMTKGGEIKITDPIKYLQESYDKKIFDEYLEPATIVDPEGEPVGSICDNDSVIFFNFREDRAKQITKAFILPGFMKFKRTALKNLDFVTFTQYEDGLPVNVAYPPTEIGKTLGKILSQKNMLQLRIAETEKFAHVTYFFNGGEEVTFLKEDRILIPSPAIDRFDKTPAMSAKEITAKVLDILELKKYAFILINYANADMVGHTGSGAAVIKAVETVDDCLSRLIPAVLLQSGCLLITADHGNAEKVLETNGEINTEHTTNPVPLWFITSENHLPKAQESIGKNGQGETKTFGLLSDIAPTVLELMEIEKPKEMTGESLLPLLK